MGFRRRWSTRSAASIRADAMFFATLVALAPLICGASRDALAAGGCSAVNTGAFNVSGGVSHKTVVGFAVGDKLTFVITWSGSGSWTLSTAGFNNLDGSPIFASSGSQTRSYAVTGEHQDTTLTQYTGGTTVTASCTAAAMAPTVTSVSPTSGPPAGGTSITITGAGFTGATSVNFGGNAASYTANSDSSITGTAPAGSGTVDVTVTTSGGTSATSAVDQFTYEAAPGATTLITLLPRADPRRRSPRSRPTAAPLTVRQSPGPTSPSLPR